MPHTVIQRHAAGESQLARRFFGLAVVLFSIGAGLAYALIRLFPVAREMADARLPSVFILTTGLLIGGSWFLGRAIQQVRIERQKPFRSALVIALSLGTLFVGLQGYGLWCLLQTQNPTEVSTGVNSFVLVFAALHAIHFCVALLFLVFVSLNAFADRYDHEYSWGVSICVYFWHFLAAVWFCILAVFAIAT